MSAKYCDEKNRQRAYSSACFLYSCVLENEDILQEIDKHIE
jgi:hypothetical protein